MKRKEEHIENLRRQGLQQANIQANMLENEIQSYRAADEGFRECLLQAVEEQMQQIHAMPAYLKPTSDHVSIAECWSCRGFCALESILNCRILLEDNSCFLLFRLSK